jgi:hypothetical protein
MMGFDDDLAHTGTCTGCGAKVHPKPMGSSLHGSLNSAGLSASPVRFARYDGTGGAMAAEERRLLPDPDVVTEGGADAIVAGRRSAEKGIPLKAVLKRYGYVRYPLGS